MSDTFTGPCRYWLCDALTGERLHEVTVEREERIHE